ncbi:MAG: Crp/Fnr family transcriptional regulator [Bacteroidota bacterium]
MSKMHLSLQTHLLTYDIFTEEQLTKIVSFFEKKVFKKKELIVRKGDVTHHVFFINRGCVRLFLIDYAGKEHTILFGTEGYWMGDLQGFIYESLASYTYQAIEDTEVLAISKSSWDKLMQEEPGFVKYVSILFRNGLIEQQNRIVEFFTLTAEERYERFIQTRPKLLNRVPQKYIATYIGITPEFLSQIRKKRSFS